jgi:hypothetical protein
MEAGLDLGLRGGAESQQLGETPAQRTTRLAAKGEECIETGTGGRLRCTLSLAGKEATRNRSGEIEDLVTDGDAAPRSIRAATEHAERKILNREIGMSVRGGHETPARQIMGFIDDAHLKIGHSLLESKCFLRRSP